MQDTPEPRARLLPARPNPARGQVELRFELQQSGPARLSLADAAGREVWSQALDQAAGRHSLTWNGRTSSGARAASGMYYLRLETAGTRLTRRFAWLK